MQAAIPKEVSASVPSSNTRREEQVRSVNPENTSSTHVVMRQKSREPSLRGNIKTKAIDVSSEVPSTSETAPPGESNSDSASGSTEKKKCQSQTHSVPVKPREARVCNQFNLRTHYIMTRYL